MSAAVSRALEAQQAAADGWLTKDGADRALQFYLGVRRWDAGNLSREQQEFLFSDQAIDDVGYIAARAHDEILEGRVYVIAENIAYGLAQAQASLPPEVPFGITQLAAGNAYVLIEGNHLTVPHPTLGRDVLRAVAWAAGPTVEDAATVRIQLWVDRGTWPPTWRQNMLAPEGFQWGLDAQHIQFSGDPARIARTSNESRAAATTVIRFLLTLGAFVSEKVVVVDRERPDRAWRRRQQRTLREAYSEPVAHVIRMRELIHTTGDRRGLGGPEWSCSWLVGSHWRRQYHPSTGDHALKWIRTYVKGDTSKPLHVSKPTVRHIVR